MTGWANLSSASNISICDDVYHPLQQGAPFDGEGMPRQRVLLVDQGVPKNLVYSRTSAKAAGKTPTGHGFALPNEYGEAPMNLVFAGGDSSLQKMVASTDRGLLVTRLWYIREVDPYEKVMTGMTRDGLFLVENGRVTGAVRNFRFNQSLIEMLQQCRIAGPCRARHRRRSVRNGRPGHESPRFSFLRSHKVLGSTRPQTSSIKKSIQRIQILRCTTAAHPFDKQLCICGMVEDKAVCKTAEPRSGSSRHPNWGHPDHDACGTGFIARLGAAPSYEIVQFALTALERLTHRGGVDADGASGDGAGLLTSLPKPFFQARAAEQGIELPEIFGVGFAFLPASEAKTAQSAIEAAADTERLRVLGWRRVPVNTDSLGRRALETMPQIWQFFVEPFHPSRGTARFEWRLALLRKRAESLLPPRSYICSLSSQTIVYKGLLTPWQFPQFYEDLRDPSFETTFAVFHQRYSTNTQPSWHLAQPFRYVAHNGEINTIVSNRRWLRAKEREIRSRLTVGPWFPILEENVSDSASFDNGFELRLLEGLSSEEAMLAMVPPAFEKDPLLSRDVRGALSTLSQQSEPWDGPAALVFSDGEFVGAKLDRNGLRPMRYTLTHDGLLIAGSETGLVDLEESRIAERQRLGPGEMILANPSTGLFLRWRDILKRLAIHQGRHAIPQRNLAASASALSSPLPQPKRVAGAAGWTEDQFKTLFSALVRGKEADWSMGDDAPPAFLSSLPRTLWDYANSASLRSPTLPLIPCAKLT